MTGGRVSGSAGLIVTKGPAGKAAVATIKYRGLTTEQNDETKTKLKGFEDCILSVQENDIVHNKAAKTIAVYCQNKTSGKVAKAAGLFVTHDAGSDSYQLFKQGILNGKSAATPIGPVKLAAEATASAVEKTGPLSSDELLDLNPGNRLNMKRT